MKNDKKNTIFIEGVMSEFIRYYNKNIPENFPKASIKSLNNFKKTHPNLFKDKDLWVVEKHRKKLMDWLSSHGEN